MKFKNTKNLFILFITLIIFSFILVGESCKKEDTLTDRGLVFSQDTLLFDTLFTTVGSTYRRLTLLNTSNKDILINNIYIGARAATGKSMFRINVNGFAQTEAKQVKVPAKDSIYVFAEVTVDPTQADLPYIVTDSLVFDFQQQIKKIQLVAWGQNANFINGEILDCNFIFKKGKPYVIYNSCLVDTLCNATIEAGAKLYFAPRSTLFVLGTLKVQGTRQDSVLFRGDRIDPFYRDQPGSWGGIHFLRGSINNSIQYADIRNGQIGVRVDSLPVSGGNPNVILENTRIQNMSLFGILGFTAAITGKNCLVTDCGRYLLICDLGGNIQFDHTTFANLGLNFNRSVANIGLSNGDLLQLGGGVQVNNMNARFRNCINYGSRDEEIEIDKTGVGSFQLVFENSLIKTIRTDLLQKPDLRCNVDPKFSDARNFIYALDTLSPAAGLGNPALLADPVLATDLLGIVRRNPPAAGCFEYTK